MLISYRRSSQGPSWQTGGAPGEPREHFCIHAIAVDGLWAHGRFPEDGNQSGLFAGCPGALKVATDGYRHFGAP